MEKQKTNIVEMIQKCNLSTLRHFAHDQRGRLSSQFLKTGEMRITDWHVIADLLVLTQSVMLGDGYSKSNDSGIERKNYFTRILAETEKWSERMNHLEDLQTGRFRLLKLHDGLIDDEVFATKFLRALRSSEQALGLTSSSKKNDRESMFEYEDIETSSTPEISSDSTDLGDFFETLWPLTLNFRHALRSHWRTTQMYRCSPTLADLSILAAYFLHCTTGKGKIPVEHEEDEIKRIDALLREITDETENADDFVKKYVYCEDQPPAIVKTSDGWLFDRDTLVMQLIYLQGETSLASNTPPNLEQPLLEKMKDKAGSQFEQWIRDELVKLGFKGPDEPIEQRYEYDVISVSHERSLIIIGEAKFRDINPSSVTGLRMIEQEFLEGDNVFTQAQRQEERLSFFLEHKERFEEFLGPRNVWESYEVKSYLVTKSQPPLSRYNNTVVMVASDFLKAVSNPTTGS